MNSKQTIEKTAQLGAFLNQNSSIALPDDDNSFFVFASKSALTNHIQAVLNKIIEEQADKSASVFVHYCA